MGIFISQNKTVTAAALHKFEVKLAKEFILTHAQTHSG
jgi:hypothetical protein